MAAEYAVGFCVSEISIPADCDASLHDSIPETTAGMPMAIASNGGNPHPSTIDGNINAKAFFSLSLSTILGRDPSHSMPLSFEDES